MPAFVKVRLTESSGGTDMFINPELVLNIVAAEDPSHCIIVLIENKAYYVEGRMEEIAQLVSY